MKKIIPLILLILLLSGCKTKAYTPEIPVSFEQNATVKSGDFSYTCKICKNENGVTVTVTSTSASGMTMTYNGHSLKLYYEDFNYNIQPKNFKKTNISIIIYELFDYIESTENLYAKKIDGGFKYEGKISCGDFILIQNDDCSLKTLTFRNIDFSVSFT